MALMAQPGLLGRAVLPELPVPRRPSPALLALPGRSERPARPEQPQPPPVRPARPARSVQLARLAQAHKVRRELPEARVQRGARVPLDPRVPPEPKDRTGLPDPWGSRALAGSLELRARRGRPDLLAARARLVPLVALALPEPSECPALRGP
jgi:hypothetical protein